jgi:tRNA U34 5-carboxymethylaminomethyl modifying GTPase MnmE/TrmE
VRDPEQGMADDFITIDLTAALNALGEITGETVGEELLETIFANFGVANDQSADLRGNLRWPWR